jgi:hypothetical protein
MYGRNRMQVVDPEVEQERKEKIAAMNEKRQLTDLCDSLILDVEVTDAVEADVPISEQRKGLTRIKFLAIVGGCGPEFKLDRSLAEVLYQKLGEYLGKN